MPAHLTISQLKKSEFAVKTARKKVDHARDVFGGKFHDKVFDHNMKNREDKIDGSSRLSSMRFQYESLDAEIRKLEQIHEVMGNALHRIHILSDATTEGQSIIEGYDGGLRDDSITKMFKNNMLDILSNFIENINSKDNTGNYIFSGNASDIMPIDKDAFIISGMNNMDDILYYNGDTEKDTYREFYYKDFHITLPVRADMEAIRRTLFIFYKGKNGEILDGYVDILKKARTDLLICAHQISESMQDIENYITQYTKERVQLKKNAESISEIDILE
ncbi:MAG: hypothetical protein O3C05_03295, partial [Proteobacteria bacterium]|nr:hypothetical protein [Pseudomonadota bacterium]